MPIAGHVCGLHGCSTATIFLVGEWCMYKPLNDWIGTYAMRCEGCGVHMLGMLGLDGDGRDQTALTPSYAGPPEYLGQWRAAAGGTETRRQEQAGPDAKGNTPAHEPR